MPFENLEYYRRKKIRDRMNAEILDEYLSHFGIRFFAPNFYMPKPDSKAVIVSLGKFFGKPYVPPDKIVIHTDQGDMIYQKVK